MTGPIYPGAVPGGNERSDMTRLAKSLLCATICGYCVMIASGFDIFWWIKR